MLVANRKSVLIRFIRSIGFLKPLIFFMSFVPFMSFLFSLLESQRSAECRERRAMPECGLRDG
jgi:hypothetical protein